MTKRKPWRDGVNIHWMICGPNSIWVSTSSYKKMDAIKKWQEQQPDDSRPWRYWYRHGYRARQVKMKFQYV